MTPMFRKGDIVTIQAEVAEDGFRDGEIRVIPDGMWSGSTYHYAKVDKLTLVKPKFEVGDEVAWRVAGLGYRGHILSIHGDHAWVDCGHGEFSTVWVDMLTRVEPESDTEATPSPEPATEPMTEAVE